MGNGIAHVFAQSGGQVVLVDLSEELLSGALSTVEKNLDRQVKKGKLTEQDRDEALGRIAPSTDMAAIDGAELVIEAVTESPAVKFEIFGEVDRAASQGAILATNTSSISITEIAAKTSRPDRVIGMHFMNPVPMMPLVEVIRGLQTSDETTATVVEASSPS